MEQLPKMTINQLKNKIAQGSYVLFFTADWCADCRFIKPAMPEIEAEFADQYQFIKVDRDENLDLCASLDVMGIPSFIVFKDGKEADRFVSKDRKTKQEVEKFLKQVD